MLMVRRALIMASPIDPEAHVQYVLARIGEHPIKAIAWSFYCVVLRVCCYLKQSFISAEQHSR